MPRQLGERLSAHQQPVSHCPRQTLAQCLSLFLNFLSRTDHQFRRRRGSRRSQVGNKINDGEVGFMPDRRDDRNFRSRNGASETFMVECRQIFRRSSAPGHDNHIYIAGFVEIANAGRDFKGRRFALHLRWKDQNPRRIVPPSKHIQDVA